MQKQQESERTSTYSRQFLDACKNNDLKKVKELYENVCYDVNIKSENGKWFGLSYALYHNNLGLIDFLLSDHNINVNMVDDFNNTVLMLACREGKTEIVDHLLMHQDIDVKMTDANNNTLLMLAFDKEKTEVFDLLIRHPDIDFNQEFDNIPDETKNSFFVAACREGGKETVQRLLATGKIDINAKNKQGKTAIMEVCSNGRFSVFNMLAQEPGLDWNIQDNSGNTAAILAMKVLDSWNFHLLLEMINIESIDWNIQNNNGASPLSTALDLETQDFWYIHGCIQELLKIPNLEVKVDQSRKYKILVEEYNYYLSDKVFKEDIGSINILNSPIVYAIKYNHRFAKVLMRAPGASKECRAYVASVMASDETLSPGENVSELVYALRKNMDNFATVLATDPDQWDIVCLVLYWRANKGK